MVSFLRLLVAMASIVALNSEPLPAAIVEERLDCRKIEGALKVLSGLSGLATKFCSSYLKVPMTAIKTTTFVPVTTKVTSVKTTTVTKPVCPARTPRHLQDESHSTEHISESLEKRDDMPPLLTPFAAAEISKACSCLNVQPKATTTFTVTAPKSIVSTSTKCVISQATCVAIDGFCTQPNDCCSGFCQASPLNAAAACVRSCDADNSPCPLSLESQFSFNCCSGFCVVLEENNPDGACSPFS